jgi:acetyl-CoA carboxylase biotin carboxylase subunit
MFRRILIANRGEIAVRIAHACFEMGLESVAVFSDVDRRALHVRKADYAYHIGPAQASQSYLNIEKILEVARTSGADAIHPGYGFLSESAEFARACEKSGIKFIGPSARAMEMMGSKTRARQTMKAAGVPLVPGSERGLETVEQALEFAEQIGYPVMLKAASGGGGKGMRMAGTPEGLHSAFDVARSEALHAFGDNEVYIEKLIEQPRHVEVQILADEHGNIIHLGERECSIQRRHQKVLEESPSPIVDPEMRQRMGEIAIRVAKVAGYTSAGTVEFLVDQQRNFYFLEMNTRLQVEHPVTELVTGLDLVQLQIRIAAGEPLPLRQEDVHIRGHAIECRIYAEDPDNNYFPSPGRITRIITASGPGIRRDNGIYEGWVVPMEYDPLLAKLSAYGLTRMDAINRMRRVMTEIFIGGIKTNISLFRRVLLDPGFQAGDFNTAFLDQLLGDPKMMDERTRRRIPIAAISAALFAQEANDGAERRANGDGARSLAATAPPKPAASNWKKRAREEALR